MDIAAIMNVLMNVLLYALEVALLGFLAYGASLVLGGGRFHRDVPEDATHPRFDLLSTH
jgi:hypothetical protein